MQRKGFTIVLKVSDIKRKYGLLPETEQEKQALAESRKAAFQAAVAAKVAELKALYASDPVKYAKFKNFTDEDWVKYAKTTLKRQNANSLKNFLSSLPNVENDPEIAKWAQYTYEEILQMEAGGVLIPAVVLQWAHSMQDNDVTYYEIDAEDGVNDGSSELKEMQAKTEKLSKKSKEAQSETIIKFEEFQDVSKKAEKVKSEQESSKKDSLKQIEELTKEWNALSDKMKKGEQLSDSDKARYKELGRLLNGEDGELMADLQASTAELEDLMNSMDNLNADIKTNIELGDETVDMAQQLSQYKNYKYADHLVADITDVSTGEVKSVIEETKGNQIAKEALLNGGNLIEYSNTLSSTLMMNQYASLYEFAGIFTQDATKTVNETKEAMGEEFDKSGQTEEETTEDSAQVEEGKDKFNVTELNKLGLGSRELIKKVEEVTKESERLAQEALKDLEEAHKKQEKLETEKQQALQKETEAQEEQQTQDVQQGIENAETPEEAQGVQEDVESEEPQQPSGEVEALNGEIEALNGDVEKANTKSLTAKERIQEYTETNTEYGKFIGEANKSFFTTNNMGLLANGVGTGFIIGGSQLIAAATTMLVQPFAGAFIAAALMQQGIRLVVLGSGFVVAGVGLTESGIEGLAKADKAANQIAETDETLQSTMEEIEVLEGLESSEEDDGLTPAQREKAQMDKSGKNVISQAIHFTGKSGEEIIKSAKAMGQLTITAGQAIIEEKKSEKRAEIIANEMGKKKEERDELQAKKDKADEQINKARKNPGKSNGEKVDFTEEDQEKLDKLNGDLEKVGRKGQEELLTSLEKVEGLSEVLNEIPDGAAAIDYGTIAQQVGLDVIKTFPPVSVLAMFTLLGLAAIATGTEAVGAGNLNKKLKEDVTDKIDESKNSIIENQSEVETATGFSADDLNKVEEDDKEAEKDETAKEKSDKDKAKEQEKGLLGIGKEAKSEQEDSKKKQADDKKEEKSLEIQMKNIQKESERDLKKIALYNKRTSETLQQQQVMADEAQMLQEESQGAVARIQAQQSAPAAAPQGGQDQGGLKIQSTGASDNAIIDQNNARIGQISQAFSIFDKKLGGYAKQINKLSASSKARQRQFNKVANEKAKVIRQHEKAEKAKQAKVEKRLGIINIANGIFSITMSVGSIMMLIPFPPGIAQAGLVLFKIGLGGILQCAILKSVVLIANGQYKEAMMTMGMAAIQVATSMIPGVGAAGNAVSTGAQQALQITSQAMNIVSTSASTIAEVQKVEGKKQSAWLGTVSQIAGAAGALTGVAGGFAGGSNSAFSKGNSLQKVGMIAQATGSTMTTVAQISTMIKSANGDEAGNFEKYMQMIGFGLQTAGSLAEIAGTIKANTDLKKVEGTDNNTQQDTQNGETQNETKAENTKNGSETKTEETKQQEQQEEIKKDPEAAEVKEVIAMNGGEVSSNATPSEMEAKIEQQSAEATQAIEQNQQESQTRQELVQETKAPQSQEETNPTVAKSNTDPKQQRKENLKKIEKDLGNVVNGATQIASAASSLKDVTPKKAGHYDVENIKKGRSLIQKVKRRYGATGNNRRFA